VPGDEGSTMATLQPGLTYWWRVTADVTDPAATPTPGQFRLFGSEVYVACAASEDCSAKIDGTRNQPAGSVAGALRLAQELGLTTVWLATRDGGAAYSETVVVPVGVSLLGGYTLDFTNRDVSANRTLIAGQSTYGFTVADVHPSDPAVLLEGL